MKRDFSGKQSNEARFPWKIRKIVEQSGKMSFSSYEQGDTISLTRKRKQVQTPTMSRYDNHK